MKKGLRDLSPEQLRDRRVLVRVDYNVPLGEGGQIEDATRLEASIPTLEYLIERGARPVLASHLGRPGGAPDPRYSLAPVRDALAKRLGHTVRFADATDPGTEAESRALGPGELLLLENTRFHAGEKEDEDDLARTLAALGDLFVNDAFGSMHRAHASTVGVTRHLRPAVAGLLVERELEALGRLRESQERPFVVAFGGAKIADKIELLEAFIERADALLVGGAMANTFLQAAGENTGRSLVDRGAIDIAGRTLARAGSKILLPLDLVVAPGPDAPEEKIRVVARDAIAADEMALDIGPETAAGFSVRVRGCRTFFWNGPMGLFENPRFLAGTFALAEAAAEATRSGVRTIIGGGDSASAVRRAGLADEVTHVSTGGGASLEFLARGTLPGVEALDDVRDRIPT